MLNEEWKDSSCKVNSKIECASLCLQATSCQGFGFYDESLNGDNCIILSKIGKCTDCKRSNVIVYEIDKWDLESKNNFSVGNWDQYVNNKSYDTTIGDFKDGILNNEQDANKISNVDYNKIITAGRQGNVNELTNVENYDANKIIKDYQNTQVVDNKISSGTTNGVGDAIKVGGVITDSGTNTAGEAINSVGGITNSDTSAAGESIKTAGVITNSAANTAGNNVNSVTKTTDSVNKLLSSGSIFGKRRKRDCSPSIISCENSEILTGIRSISRNYFNSSTINSVCKKTDLHGMKSVFFKEIEKEVMMICPPNQAISELLFCLLDEEGKGKIENGIIKCSLFEENLVFDKESMSVKVRENADSNAIFCPDNMLLTGIMINDNENNNDLSLKCSKYQKL
ncbi:uncharacterized protein [Centruroides vittatus]|uniref:uncharacterized protein n=1 Tax=Centruroides vittatus TaxID=120091 RepID=UPI00350FC015